MSTILSVLSLLIPIPQICLNCSLVLSQSWPRLVDYVQLSVNRVSKMQSGLEVRETPESSMPEHVRNHVQKEAVHYTTPLRPSQHAALEEEEKSHQWEKPAATSARRWYSNPYLLAGLAALVSALIVGAVVGGGLGSRLQESQAQLHQW